VIARDAAPVTRGDKTTIVFSVPNEPGALFKALADATRLRILGLLLTGEVCVCDIHESLRIAQPKASRHLAYLRRAVLVATRSGELLERTAEDYEIGYRHVTRIEDRGSRSELPSPACGRGVGGEGQSSIPDPRSSDEFFVAARLKFEQGDGRVARQEIKELLSKRSASQPLNLPNAGSVFRNPSGDHAARLIQQCGLKGRRIGGAQVSEKHANFIVNTGGATAADIENLINEVHAVVEQQTGVKLQCEVRIVGEAA